WSPSPWWRSFLVGTAVALRFCSLLLPAYTRSGGLSTPGPRIFGGMSRAGTVSARSLAEWLRKLAEWLRKLAECLRTFAEWLRTGVGRVAAVGDRRKMPPENPGAGWLVGYGRRRRLIATVSVSSSPRNRAKICDSARESVKG